VDRYFGGEGTSVFLGVKGGYDPTAVDLAVDKREDELAVAAARARRETMGAREYDDAVRVEGLSLLERASRPAGQKFRQPERRRISFGRSPWAAGYELEGVDRVCNRIADAVEDQLAGHLLETQRRITPQEIRTSAFAPGSPGYDETQVDAFLDDAARFLAVASAGIHREPRRARRAAQ
jgi:DivIVA domain-containing protein